MKKKSVFLFQIFAIIFAFSVYGQKFVDVTKSNSGQKIELAKNQVLEIKLPSNPSTGYGWYTTNINKSAIIQIGDWEYLPDSKSGDVGQWGTQITRFVGNFQGTTELELGYMRPWEKNTAPADNFKITVISKGKYTGNYKPVKPKPVGKYNPSLSQKSLPSSFSWLAQNGCTPIKDQGSCGSCWAFAACGTFESNIKIIDGVTRDLAEQWLVNCATDMSGCSGGWCPHHWWQYPGAVYESQEPYIAVDGTCDASYTYYEVIDSYADVIGGPQPADADIKQAIYDYGPVWVAIDAGSNFQNYPGGIFTTSDGTTVNHAVVLVGWDDSGGYWILRNSWGTGWGESGYMRIAYGVSVVGNSADYIVYKGGIPHNVPPVADFSACPITKCTNAPFTVQFNNLSINGLNTYTWYFGDGGTSTATNPLYTYAANGSYNVKLVAINGYGSDSITKNAYITVGPAYPCAASMPATGTGITQTNCAGTLYDSGVCSDYTDNTNGTITISPAGASSVTITFSSFNFESGYDYLYIYNGPTTASPQFTGSPFTGSTIPGPFTSSGGSVTIRQTSDPGVVASGFIMDWTCSSPTQPPIANFSSNVTTSCTGIINFTDLSTSGPTSWLWDFGDGQTSTLQNPTYTYTANGTYTVTLTATNSYGNDQEIKTNYIAINMPVTPTTTSASRCGTGSVTLTASGTGTLLWYDAPTGGNLVNTGTSFSTPSLTTTTNYYVQDSIPGTIHNCAKPDNSGGGSYASTGNHYEIFDCTVPVKLISVKMYGNITPPGNRTIELRGNTGAVLQSASVNVQTGLNTYSLNFDIPAATNLRLACEGTNIYRNNAGTSYPYTTPGFISVTNSSAGSVYYYYFYDWVIQEHACISPRAIVTATINPADTAGVSISANPGNVICSGTNVTFTATAINGGTTPTYQWKINGSDISGEINPTYTSSTLANGDIITCEMTSNATCVSGSPAISNTITMLVGNVITAVITPAGSTTFCVGDSVILNANTGTGYSFQWQFNGSDITGATDSFYTATQAGDYTVNVTNNCASATSNPITITVNISPVAIITPNGPTSFCQGDSVILNANTGTGYSFQWQFNGSDITGATDSFYTAMQDGNYTVNVINVCDTITSAEISITIYQDVSVTAVATGNTSFCDGGSVVLNANPSTGYNYQWQFNGNNITGAILSSYTVNLSGNYTVIITNGNCTDTSNIINITVFPLPSTPVLTQTGDSLISSAGYGNQWYYMNQLGSILINGATDSIYSPFLTGLYYVIVTDQNGCVSDTSNIIEFVITSVTENTDESVRIYPNPAFDYLTLILAENKFKTEIKVYNILGIEKLCSTIEGTKTNIDISNLSDGVYIIEVISGNRIIKHKFVIH